MPNVTYKIIDHDPSLHTFTVKVSTDDKNVQNKEDLIGFTLEPDPTTGAYSSLLLHKVIMRVISNGFWEKWKIESVSPTQEWADIVGKTHTEEYNYAEPIFSEDPFVVTTDVDTGTERV